MNLATATEAAAADRSERALHNRVEWFVKKWADEFDLNRQQSAELSADLVMVIQEAHRDASRTTHDLLSKSLAAMPMPPPVFVTKSDRT